MILIELRSNFKSGTSPRFYPYISSNFSHDFIRRYISTLLLENFFKAPNQKLEFSEKNLSQNRLFFHLNDRQKSVFRTSKLKKNFFLILGNTIVVSYIAHLLSKFELLGSILLGQVRCES